MFLLLLQRRWDLDGGVCSNNDSSIADRKFRVLEMYSSWLFKKEVNI